MAGTLGTAGAAAGPASLRGPPLREVGGNAKERDVPGASWAVLSPKMCSPKMCAGRGRAGTRRPALPSVPPTLRPFRNPSGLTGALPFPKFSATAESFRAAGSKITVNQRGTRVGFVQTPAIFFNSDRTPVLQLQRILTASCKSPQIQHTQQSRLTGIQGCPAPLLEAPQEPQTSAVLQLPAALHPSLWVCPPDLRLGLNLSPGSGG